MGAKLKFWRWSRVPKKGSRDEAVEIFPKKGSRDEVVEIFLAASPLVTAVKSHSTILQRLRRQISLDYYTIPPATQASTLARSSNFNHYTSSPF